MNIFHQISLVDIFVKLHNILWYEKWFLRIKNVQENSNYGVLQLLYRLFLKKGKNKVPTKQLEHLFLMIKFADKHFWDYFMLCTEKSTKGSLKYVFKI